MQSYEAVHGPDLKFGHIRVHATSALLRPHDRRCSFFLAAGDALLRRLAATGVGGGQILAEGRVAGRRLGGLPPHPSNHQSTIASTTTATPPPVRSAAAGSGPCPTSASTSYRCRPTPGPGRLRAPTGLPRTVSHLGVHLLSLPPYARSSQATSTHRELLGSPLSPAGLHIRIGNPEMHFSRDELIGSAFIAFGITLFVCFFYVAIVSKLLPPYENPFLAAIQNDWYYCLLVPLTLPVIIVAVYLHWLSMKMFKHA